MQANDTDGYANPPTAGESIGIARTSFDCPSPWPLSSASPPDFLAGTERMPDRGSRSQPCFVANLDEALADRLTVRNLLRLIRIQYGQL